jgi:UDP-glucose 4-epimerase
MKVLITGGAGFLGSTIASACADAGHVPVILDDLSKGLAAFAERFDHYVGDYGDTALVARVLAEHSDIDAVVHCAASIVVPESMAEPLAYYANNVAKLPGFLATLADAGVNRVLFSSTAALYDHPEGDLVVTETSPLRPQSPYAASKQMVERILTDTAAASDLRVVCLRYFNPIGADPQLRSGLQLANPSHALGSLIAAAEQGRPFTVTGVDWPTRDGSGLRDYIHVWDLALAHVAALERFEAITDGREQRAAVINLGSGHGTTVCELVAAFTQVTGIEVEVVHGARRPGDLAGACASAELAAALLDWRAERSVTEGIADSLRWREKLLALLA